MRFILPLVLAALILGVPSQATATSAAPQRVYWGSYIDGVPWDSARLAQFEQTAGKGESIENFGESWFHGTTSQPFPTDAMNMVRNHGSIPMLTWLSFDSDIQVSVPNTPQYRDSVITAGTYDAYITQWARDAKQWGHPFFLRFDHEMNGWWRFPWAEQINGNQPGDYVRMWRHVHDLFSQVGVTNATWVWNPNYDAPPETAYSDLYPGPDYVDWTALDGYNWGNEHVNLWQSFAQIFGGIAPVNYGGKNSYQELLDMAPGKPIMIAETGTSTHGGYASAWVTDVLTLQIPKDFVGIKALVWMEDDWTINSRIDVTSAEASAFKAGIASPFYVSNEFGALPGSGKVQPLR